MPGERLRTGNDLVDRPDPNLTSVEFNHDIATMI